jgi:hypothetical protein
MSQIKYNVVGFSTEIGPGSGFVIDYWKSFNDQFELPKKPTFGINVSYDHFKRFMGRGGISLGLGFNATSFSQAIIFQNTPKAGNPSPEKHEFGASRNYYLNIDLPIRYYVSYSVGPQWIISPYFGLKLRSIAYIGNEGRETTVGGGYHNTNGVDTLFYIRYTIEYGSYSSRILFLPHSGIQFSKQLSSGNTINYFVEYNPGSINAAEFRYMNFDNVENNIGYPELAEKTMRFRIRPAHLRIGFSYSFNKSRDWQP